MIEITDLLGPGEEVSGNILCCPACGCDWTHVEKVIFGARKEDATPLIRQVDLITGEVTPVTDEVRSERRQWITLLLSCEQCYEDSRITFAQHKGVTFVDVENFVTEESFALFVEDELDEDDGEGDDDDDK